MFYVTHWFHYTFLDRKGFDNVDSEKLGIYFMWPSILLSLTTLFMFTLYDEVSITSISINLGSEVMIRLQVSLSYVILLQYIVTCK